MSVRAQRQRLAAQVEPMRELEKLIRENSYRHPVHQVFADFVELSALSLSNTADIAQHEKREARYMDIVRRYEKTEVERFCHMLGCLVCALEDEPRDHLGKLFMALELGNHWHGQFFTPYELCVLMAKMQLHDASELVAAKGFITVNEPAAGAGAMVIACAQALRDLDINYQQAMHVTAVDVDATAAQMCYLQMSLLHIPGVVVVGNTLTLEERERWYTPAHIVGGWNWKLRRGERGASVLDAVLAVAESVESASAPVPAAKLGQLDLFGGAL